MLNRALLSLSLLLLCCATTWGQGINWTGDLAAARKAAAEQRRLILLHFYSDDCPPCEKLEQAVFPTPEVSDAANRNYIPVKVYVKQAPALVKQYQVNRWPTDVIVTPNGQEVFRTISPGNARDYALMLNQIALQSGVGAGRTDTGYTPNAVAAFPSSADALAQAHAIANDTQQQLQQAAGQTQQQFQLAAGQAQQQAGQQVNAWQQQALDGMKQLQQQADTTQQQVQQRASQYQDQAVQAQQQVQQQVQQQTDQLQQQANQLQQAGQQKLNAGIDYIAQATTLPSMLPPRRSPFSADQVATSAPQPGTIHSGTTDVARPETVRANAFPGSGEAQYVQPTVPIGQEPPPPATASNAAVANNRPQQPVNRYPNPGQEYAPPTNRPPQQPWVNPLVGQPNGGPQMQSNPFYNPNGAPPAAAGSPPAAPPTAPNHSPNPGVTPANVTAAPPGRQASQYDAPQQPQQAPLSSMPIATAPPAPPPTALDGYCPVTLLESKKWKKADPQFGAIHRGGTYLFASQECQQKFLADPDRYAPILAGHDPVRFADNGQLVGGVRKHGIMYRNQIFLFADEASLTKFTQSPDRYSSTAYQAMAQADPTYRR